MRFQSITVVFLACFFCLVSWLFAPPAYALTQIKLYDLSYQDCPAEFAKGNVTSGGYTQSATCYMVTGKAKNPKGKTLYDADVYGRIYDANGNPVFQNRGRVGSIAEVPPGVSNFAIRISVAANQPTPLQLKQFRASGFTSPVRPIF